LSYAVLLIIIMLQLKVTKWRQPVSTAEHLITVVLHLPIITIWFLHAYDFYTDQVQDCHATEFNYREL